MNSVIQGRLHARGITVQRHQVSDPIKFLVHPSLNFALPPNNLSTVQQVQ